MYKRVVKVRAVAMAYPRLICVNQPATEQLGTHSTRRKLPGRAQLDGRMKVASRARIMVAETGTPYADQPFGRDFDRHSVVQEAAPNGGSVRRVLSRGGHAW
jgi:hypothetical protein